MNGPYAQIHIALCAVPRQERKVIVKESLAQAAADVPELERLRRQAAVKELGTNGMRELAHALCLWGEREGVLDALFPVAAVNGDGADELA